MQLSTLVQTAAAIRLRQRLQPEGGSGDKLFPPTYPGGHYCWEERRIEGQTVPCVLLDAVASQANRLEEALAVAVRADGLELPRQVVHFDGDLADLGEVSTLAAPHRVFDAILRDSTLDGVPLFKTTLYKQFTACNVRNATALFASAPSALLFGCWDSTGAAGGLGNKFARAITSEIVGIGAEWGSTQGGLRQDGLGISSEVEIAIAADGDWSLAGKSTAAKKDRAKGTRPSEVNHGNVLVKVETATHEQLRGGQWISRKLPLKGGVTVDYALQTCVLSLTALRRLQFPLGDGGAAADHAARTVLAALGLVAITALREQGYWLRSRCALVADGLQALEIVHHDGRTTALELEAAAARAAYREAVAAAQAAGLPWNPTPVQLKPMDKLVELIRRSREVQQLGTSGS